MVEVVEVLELVVAVEVAVEVVVAEVEVEDEVLVGMVVVGKAEVVEVAMVE
jgi:hypothetical protein